MTCENGEYLESFNGDSVIACDEIVEPIQTTPINLSDKKTTCKINNF